MRGSRIFAGLVIIALIAIGLIYLEDKGVFSNASVDRIGLLKSNDVEPPKPATDTDKPPISADDKMPPAKVEPDDKSPTASTDTTSNNEAVTSAQDAANNVPTKPAASRVQYVDKDGNACRPIQVQEPTPAVHHYHRRRMPDTWTYRPARGGFSTPCGMIHQTATGQRVVNLVSGMVLNIALDHELSTMDTSAGQDFSGYLVGPITYCGEVIVPAGSAVEGTVLSTRRHTFGQEDDSILQLRLSALDANGYRVPLSATSYNRRTPSDFHYKTTNYMNDPNYIETTHTSNRDVTLPAQSVVSFWLQGSTAVYF